MNDAISLLKRFIELWEGTWSNPNDPSHMYSEYYEYAKLIIATENRIQDDMAVKLLSLLDDQWTFDNQQNEIDVEDLLPDWVQLHCDIVEYLPGL